MKNLKLWCGDDIVGIKMMHHVCIQTENYGESLEFYTKVLGFKIIQETKNFHNRDFNTWLRLGKFMIELQTNKKEDKLNNWNELNEGIVHMCFLVDNVQEEFDRIKELGYTKFKLKNDEALYKVENEYLFKIRGSRRYRN